jgi:cell division protease FtsH
MRGAFFLKGSVLSMSEFDKVIGYEDIKMELKRYCDVVKNPEKYRKLGVQTPSGILMHGNPGLGKSLMAKCFIAESGRKVFTLRKNQSDGDFVNTIRETFEKAKQAAPCIVFLDDMDKFANEDREHPDAEEYVAVQAGIDECKGSEVFLLATVNDRRSRTSHRRKIMC